MILNYHICFDLPVENAQSYFHFNLISSVIFSPTNCLPIFYISSFLLSFIFSIIHSFTYSFLHSFLHFLSNWAKICFGRFSTLITFRFFYVIQFFSQDLLNLKYVAKYAFCLISLSDSLTYMQLVHL